MDTTTVVIVGAAVAAPALLRTAARAGVPVPAYVTDAHRKALAELDDRGVPGGEQAFHRWNEYNRRLIASRGAATGHANLANLTDEDLDTLCTAYLEAAKAGAFDVIVKPYEPVPGWADAQRLNPAAGLLSWSLLADADQRKLTDFGRAVARVMKIQEGLSTGFLSSPADILSANLAVSQLAIEMDDQGYLLTGKPYELESTTTKLKDFGGLVGEFAAEQSAAAARAALGALWSAVTSEPLFFAVVVGAGYVAVKAVL